ncbi:MAG TPA: FHA domain-containing protein [Humibacillus xanthopallidus]|nr:FHA domain-containing protein [Humibacillus xanthopallidus]
MSAVCPNGHTSESEDYCDTCGSPIDLSAQPAASSVGAAGAAGTAGPAVPPGSATASGAAAGSPSGSSLDLEPPPGSGSGAAGAAAGAGEGGGAGAAATGPTTLECPNCHTENADGALFCEACGYDFTTGAMPRDPSAPSDGGEASDGAAGAAGAAGGGEPSTAFEWLAEVWIDPDWYKTQEAEDPCPSPGLPVIVPLRSKSVLLGRVSTSRNTHPELDLSSDPGVSRRHAQLTTDGSRWFVEDLGSSNGTYVAPAAGPLPERAIAVGPRTELSDDDRLYVGAWTRIVVRKATPDEVEAYA